MKTLIENESAGVRCDDIRYQVDFSGSNVVPIDAWEWMGAWRGTDRELALKVGRDAFQYVGFREGQSTVKGTVHISRPGMCHYPNGNPLQIVSIDLTFTNPSPTLAASEIAP